MKRLSGMKKTWASLSAALLAVLTLLGGCGEGTPTDGSESGSSQIVTSETVSVESGEPAGESSTESLPASSETSSAGPSSASPSSSAPSAAAPSSSKSKTSSVKPSSSAKPASSSVSSSPAVNLEVFDLKSAEGKLGVWFFNMPHTSVHTGDCTLIKFPNGKTMLIDAGNADGGRMVQGYLDKMGVKRIDVFVITHMHQDHVGGATEIVNKYEIGAVYGTPHKDYNTQACRNFHNAINKKELTYQVLRTGDKINVDPKVSIETLYPGPDYRNPTSTEGSEINNSSVVLRMDYESRSFLFTGDIEMEVEQELVEKMPQKLKVDVLKIPHHGASTSSTYEFVNTVKAKYGAIMVYAMNDIFVINRYRDAGTHVHLTSVDGTALFVTDGKNLLYAKK